MKQFTKELGELINRHSLENQSDTPDYILAEYLTEILVSFNRASCKREQWYGRKTSPGESVNSAEKKQPCGENNQHSEQSLCTTCRLRASGCGLVYTDGCDSYVIGGIA
jgi:hypothetical protein